MKISIITACFNNEDTIRDTIASVNEQNYANIEHVFIDGSSTDHTLDIIHSLAARDRKVVSEPDAGIYDALNKGLACATGDVIGFLHADDFFPENSVVSALAHAFSNPVVQGVYGDLEYVSKGKDGKIIRHWKSKEFSPSRLRRGWMPPHPTLYVRKSWYVLLGGFDTQFSIAADYFSILKLFEHSSFYSRYIPKVLVKMRVGGASNKSLENILRKSQEDLKALRLSGVGGLGTLVAKNIRKVGQWF